MDLIPTVDKITRWTENSGMLLRGILFGALTALLATAVVIVMPSEPASAAECESFASYGIKVCGTWNGDVEFDNGASYAMTHSFVWNITRPDRTLAIKNVKVWLYGVSKCTASPGYAGCKTFYDYKTLKSRAATGKSRTVPSWAGKLGLVQGTANGQISQVTFTWCHGGKCHAATSFQIGAGRVG